MRPYEEAREVLTGLYYIGDSGSAEYTDSAPFGGRFARLVELAKQDSLSLMDGAFAAVRAAGGMTVIAEKGRLRRGRLGII